MTLHALDYACVTDDVVVKDFACTSTGRIFFAGDDEALYEVEYSAGDTWRARRCRKTCHHSATPKLLPSILRLRAPDALRQVLVDEDRCALYTRSDSGVVAVYDLGAALADAPRRVAEVRDVAAARARGAGGRLVLRRARRDRARSTPRTARSRSAAAAVIEPRERAARARRRGRAGGSCTSPW